MPAPVRVHVVHTYSSSPAEVFAALAEHENLGRIFPAKVTRLRDGDTERNGVGSARRLRVGLLPSFVETVTHVEPERLIEYRITQGSPLKGHWGRQVFTPTASGGTTLDYTIGFDAVAPGLAPVVAAGLTRALTRGLPTLVP